MTLYYILFFYLPVYFFALISLSRLFIGRGSDHYFHDYFIQVIKQNKNKFFSRFPNFIDDLRPTDPQLMYKIISYLPSKYRNISSILLNPISLLFLIFSFIFFLIFNTNLDHKNIAVSVLLLSSTPQYFYAQNARLYGFSSRGLGLVIGFLVTISLYLTLNTHIYYFIFLIIFCYLSWLSNLFLQQYLFFLSLLLSLLFNINHLFFAEIVSIVLTIFFHYEYSISFFKSRLKYLIIYQKYLSKRFILNYRYSIYRDFIYDFWKKNNYKSISNWLSYLYNNSILIIIFLNPYISFSFFNFFDYQKNITYDNPLLNFSYQVIICSFLSFFITSFRSTRFLGEPERYIEMAIPWLVIFTIILVKNNIIIFFLLLYSFIISITQIYFFIKSRNKLYPKNDSDLVQIISSAIDNHSNGQDVRLFSNCMDTLKKQLNLRWKFLIYYPTNNHLGGINIGTLFTKYPIVNDLFIEKLIYEKNINYLIINKRFSSFKKNTFISIFDNNQYVVYFVNN